MDQVKKFCERNQETRKPGNKETRETFVGQTSKRVTFVGQTSKRVTFVGE